MVVILVQLVVMIRLGWLRDWFPGISQWWVLFLNPASITAMLFIAYAMVLKRNTGSTRMAAIGLFTVALIGLIIFTAIGILFRGPNWEFYWSASQWPAV